MSPLCVECGSEADGLVRGSCPACFAAKNPLLALPEAVDVELCAHCGARRAGKHWHEAEEGVPESWQREDAVLEQTRVHKEVRDPVLEYQEAPEDARHHRATMRLVGTVEGATVTAEGATTTRTRRGVCDRCSRMFGGFYAAILQLRATDRDLSPEELEAAHGLVATELERQRGAGNRASFLSKDEAVQGGHDYYVGDIEAARNAARLLKDRLGASMQESAKLVGRREGDDVHRVTFLVRVRRFAPGDYAEADDLVVQVQSVDRGHAIVLDMASHRRTRLPEAALRRIGGREVLREAVLVFAGPDELQLLDPVEQRTVDVPRPASYEVEGETVPVLRHDRRLYLVPSRSAQPTTVK